jgi:hypothetical protein
MGELRPNLREILSPELARTFGVDKSGVGAVSTGIAALDAELWGGFPRAAVTEIISDHGHGGDWLALRVLAHCGGDCAVLDSDESFFPPGAAAVGVDLTRLMIVREKKREQSPLGAGAAGARAQADRDVFVDGGDVRHAAPTPATGG